MQLLLRARRFVRARLKAWGPPSVAKKVWDAEFAEGSWDFIDNTTGDFVYQWIEKYAQNGDILDLGCGAGNTGNELRADCYRKYVGVDISDIAVQKAISRSKENGRAGKNSYFQGDISRYEPSGTFDVILFRESIWYIPRAELGEVLDRYRRHLTTSGVIIIRMHNRFLFADIIQILKERAAVIGESIAPNGKDIILALR